jgi:hypothetical protein
MILLKDGVKYSQYEYVSEEELAQMVVEHYKDIFGINSLYFDPQTMKTQIGIEARNDGLILATDQNRWYIVEVELAKHPLHEHIIPQITKFSIAYEEAETRKKIIDTLYRTIRQDPIRTATIQTQKIEDLHKILTDLIDMQPTIAIIIDQKTPELDHICKKLPFPTQTIEFKTYARENIGIGVHIHEFQPLFEKIIKIGPKKPLEKRLQKLMQVLEVAELVFKEEQLSKAFKKVAKQHGIVESSVRDKCTRQLGIDTEQFKEIIQDKNRFITFLKEKYPQCENLINKKLA